MKHPNMQAVGFSVNYINDYPGEEGLKNNEFLPPTYAMHWCMIATYMNRLFTKDDMHEFLFRLAITLDTLKVMENWFSYDKLMNFEFMGKPCIMTAEDIVAHYGLEVSDSVNNGSKRDFYMENIAKGIRNAMFTAAFDVCQVILPKQIGENTLEIAGEKYMPEITDKLLKNADFFANDIIKLAPEGYFEKTNEFKIEKLKEIEERKLKITQIPEFDIDSIPEEIIHQCLKIMLHPETYSYYTEKADKDEYDEEKYRLIFFAWLWANDLMVSDELSASEVEGVVLDVDEYELQGDDCGINLLQTYYNHNVEEVMPLLKGIGIKSKL